jgi:macrodomain Ter protein organizer (MatP/YcbG family)
MNGKRRRLQLFLVPVAFGLLLTSGCATTNGALPEKILQGDEAIKKAAESNATMNAPGELNAAKEKLVQAKQAAYKRDYDRATRLAEEVSIDADYARYKAASEKARKVAEDLRKNIKLLRQEVDDLSKQ